MIPLTVLQQFCWAGARGLPAFPAQQYCITRVWLGRCARVSCVPCPTTLYHKSFVGQVRAGFLRSLPNNTVSEELCWAGARGFPAFPAQHHCITTVLLGRCARASCVPCPTTLYQKSFGGEVRAGFLRSLPDNTVSHELCWAGARGLPAFPAQHIHGTDSRHGIVVIPLTVLL